MTSPPAAPVSLFTVATFLAILAVLAAVADVVLVAIAAVVGAGPRRALRDAIGPYAIWMAAVVALTAMAGSLYFSEVAHLEPCVLCWYQRIAMYALAVILVWQPCCATRACARTPSRWRASAPASARITSWCSACPACRAAAAPSPRRARRPGRGLRRHHHPGARAHRLPLRPCPGDGRRRARRSGAVVSARTRRLPRRTVVAEPPRIPALWVGGAAVVVVLLAAILTVVLTSGTRPSEPGPTVGVAGARLAQLPTDGADPALGARLPTLTGTGLDGKPLTIGPSGKPQVILIVAHWCPHCQAEVPRLVSWLRTNSSAERRRVRDPLDLDQRRATQLPALDVAGARGVERPGAERRRRLDRPPGARDDDVPRLRVRALGRDGCRTPLRGAAGRAGGADRGQPALRAAPY